MQRLVPYLLGYGVSSSEDKLNEEEEEICFEILFVGMFYRQCMLVIDGKYNNDDGLSTGRMCQAGTRSLLGRRCRASSTRSEYAAMDLIEDFPMNVRYEPEVRPALDPGELTRSLTSKVKCETPKNHLNKDSISEFRLPGDGEVKSRDSPTQESRSREM
jgi:hypothetical protein